ncbi:conjugal transfer protein TraD [Rhizobium gallicum]|uniref:conjugal transfer protein TraD n=1 Tax=Rhizobium gallicum TaxID=56730 RepID=UPI001EF997AD|nr:conjugal transfer protein TraD [Rhizobium gallicum]ULJ72335.1 conjugal transfer protein TraD [Rhizobium gallicum]
MTAERKREAREKILLGAIVVKAGLSKADRAFLLGGLLELARIAPGSPEHQRLRDIGKAGFIEAPSLDTVQEKAEWH